MILALIVFGSTCASGFVLALPRYYARKETWLSSALVVLLVLAIISLSFSSVLVAS